MLESVLKDKWQQHGNLAWTTEGTVYAGHYRRMFLSDFNTENWTMVLGRKEQTILQPLADFQKTLLGLLVLTFLFVFLLSAAGIRQNLEPLAKLREGTRRLAAQDFSARVRITSGDEFEELGGSFNNMAEKVGTLVGELKDLNWSTITTLARTSLPSRTQRPSPTVPRKRDPSNGVAA